MLVPLLLLLAPLSLELQSPAAILMNADTGTVLYEKNAHESRDPASTTKIATCLYALTKNPNFDLEVTGTPECLNAISEKDRLKRGYALPNWRLEKAACHMGIKVGEVLTLRDLFNGMMVASADDASNMIAETMSSDIATFIREMNAYLKRIGCNNTTFHNPHGLYHPEHKSTAYDLALMTKVALKNPVFCSFVGLKDFMRPKTNKQEATKYLQTNRLLRAGKYNYPGAIGVKTGHFSTSKYCLVAAAEKGGRKLIAVILGAPDSATRFEEAIALLDAGFSEKPVKKEILKAGIKDEPIPHPSGKKAILKTKEPLTFETYPSDKEEVCLAFEWFPKRDKGRFILKDVQGNIRKEVIAELDSFVENEEKPFSWAWLPLFAVPITGISSYCFLKRS